MHNFLIDTRFATRELPLRVDLTLRHFLSECVRKTIRRPSPACIECSPSSWSSFSNRSIRARPNLRRRDRRLDPAAANAQLVAVLEPQSPAASLDPAGPKEHDAGLIERCLEALEGRAARVGQAVLR